MTVTFLVNCYLSNEKQNTLVDDWKVEPTIPFVENFPFSLKLFSSHFYGQSFIKTSEVLSKYEKKELAN